MSLLRLEDLSVTYSSADGPVPAVGTSGSVGPVRSTTRRPGSRDVDVEGRSVVMGGNGADR